ncbi:MAG: flagellar hook capping FlgD N-terminal domain-containing protein [Pseudomonadota bacterium]|nr:flagellar hook capping FlgD N-terminal domain-containing protein [Pseudomonadota bacterium]
MTDINPAATATTTPSTTTASTSSASSSNSAVSAATIGEDFDTFLQLLTAQIRNQDPLAPMDSTQFVEQLATFSSLEQQVETNKTLENIASMIGDLHSSLGNEWLGQDVAVRSQYIAYEGAPVQFEVDQSRSYDQAVVTVTDSQNNVVWQDTLDPGQSRHIWDGNVLGQSTRAPNGIYSFQIDLYENGNAVASTQPDIITKVTALGTENGQLKFGTDSHLTTDLNNVRKVAVN